MNNQQQQSLNISGQQQQENGSNRAAMDLQQQQHQQQQLQQQQQLLLQPPPTYPLVQQNLTGYLTTNPLITSPFVASSVPANLATSNHAAFLTAVQQQQYQQSGGINSVPIPLNPYTTIANTSFLIPSVPDPLALTYGNHNNQTQTASNIGQFTAIVPSQDNQTSTTTKNATSSDSDGESDRMQTIRDRNRVHARSTRQRKKAYIHQLQSLVDNFHSERNEEIRQRMVAQQRSMDIQKVRRSVIATFLKYHSNYQTDVRKWSTILEDTFWLKQPITPFRSFRRSEIDKECRISRGIEAIINDAASLSVMLESIGCHSSRWIRIKRENFLRFEELKRCPGRKKPSCVERQDSRFRHTVSSLTSSSDVSNEKRTEDSRIVTSRCDNGNTSSKDCGSGSGSGPNKVSSSSGGSGGSGSDGGSNGSNVVQNYHNNCKTLPDSKKTETGLTRRDSSPSDESPEDSSDISFDGQAKRPISSDLSSSEYDSDRYVDGKRRKSDHMISGTINLPTNISSNGEVTHPTSSSSVRQCESTKQDRRRLYGTIGMDNNSANGPHLIAVDNGDGSSDSDSNSAPQIEGRYHFNDDELMIVDDILMCPFVFRSHNAVLCGAMAECVMPGMLRARFSIRNKLQSLELVYDAMGFMQQLERASGNDRTTQVIPGSLDMALSPCDCEARVITLAQPPYLIVNVNEVWTHITGFTQMESEGNGLLQLLEGDATVADAKHRSGKPIHTFDKVAKGQSACSTNVHYDRNRRDFVEFFCSYPLSNAADEITHILHVSHELPSFHSPVVSTTANVQQI